MEYDLQFIGYSAFVSKRGEDTHAVIDFVSGTTVVYGSFVDWSRYCYKPITISSQIERRSYSALTSGSGKGYKSCLGNEALAMINLIRGRHA